MNAVDLRTKEGSAGMQDSVVKTLETSLHPRFPAASPTLHFRMASSGKPTYSRVSCDLSLKCQQVITS